MDSAEIIDRLEKARPFAIELSPRTWLKVANAISIGIRSPLFPTENQFIAGHVLRCIAKEMPEPVRQQILDGIPGQ